MVQWRSWVGIGCLWLAAQQVADAEAYYLPPCDPTQVYELPFSCMLEGAGHSMLQIDTRHVAKGIADCKFTYEGLSGHPNPSVVILSRSGKLCGDVVSKTIPVLTTPWPPHPTEELIKTCLDQGEYGDYIRFILQAGSGFLPVQVSCQ